jgi:uncharacterized membrane protein YqgA involved in biofilm formation
VTGTILNVIGIIAGGAIGLIGKKPLTLSTQKFFKMTLGLVATAVGLRLTWVSLSAPFSHGLKQLGIVVLALVLGKLTGRLLRLQKTSNRLGQFARERMAAVKPDDPRRFSDGFDVCAILFCAAPLGIVGAICDGLAVPGSVTGSFFPLAIKAVMDALAAMSFVMMFGPGVLFSAVPVLVFQGTITLLCSRFLQPLLQAHGLIEPVNAASGLLVFCVALVIFEIRKIELTDYLPSLVFAPLLTLWLR